MKRWLFLLLLAFIPLTASDLAPAKAVLIHEEETIQPGRPFWVAVHITIEDNWHTYWKNPGEVGAAPRIDWTLPDGYSVKEMKWPAPTRFEHDNTVTFGYEKEVILLAEIVPAKEPHEHAILEANIRTITCSSQNCHPVFNSAKLELPVHEKEPEIASAHSHLFSKGRKNLPVHAKHAVALTKNAQVAIKLPESKGAFRARFFPEESDGFDFTQTSRIVDETVHLPASGLTTVKGVLLLEHEDGAKTAYKIDHAITEETKSELQGQFLLALLFAFCGGLLLNLMPCVLPVISFKIMGFVKMAGENRLKIFQHGLIFTLGVVLSFWVLAATMLALQSYGHAIGWGFQLQNPLFVGILAALIFIFSLSLFGVFELGTSLASKAGNLEVRKEGLSSSFFSGILATAVATPCSGPFLGTAIGFAVTQPAIQAMTVFTMLALGLSFPYLIIGLFPTLIRFLPKPGRWMGTFKEIMGFIMLATVIWLTWVFGALTTTSALTLLTASFFIFALGCYLLGKWGTPVTPKITRLISHTLTLFCFLLGGYTLYQASTAIPDELYENDFIAQNETQKSRWVKFSPEKVEELRKEGVPVFIDFTAKWCLICQANHAVLSSDSVQSAFDERGVVRMIADWTRSDPVITEELKKHGRNSVPLYLYYAPGAKEADVLPQVLTKETVIEHLESTK